MKPAERRDPREGRPNGGGRLPGSRRARLIALAIVLTIGALWFLIDRIEAGVDLEAWLDTAAETLGAWTYLIAGVMAFMETGAFVGLVAPGETFVIFAGAVAGQGATDFWITLGVVWAGAYLGDTVSFMLGRHLGRGFVLRHGHRLRITPERFAKVEQYFERHGGKTILFGRFVGIIRALAPFVAGSSGMRYRNFAPPSILGTGLWGASNVLIGYIVARNLDRATQIAGTSSLVTATVIVSVVLVVLVVRYLRDAENRDRLVAWLDRKVATRWAVRLARRWRPQLRFLGQRLTPGGLGLEFSALAAAAAVAGYIVITYAVIVSGAPGPTPGDREAFDIAGAIRTDALTEVARAVSVLGSGPFVLGIAIVAGLGLAWGRYWAELCVVAAAMVAVFIAVPELKEQIARPRPLFALAGSSGDAYPSGHAAYAVIYPWLALTVAVRLRPGWAGATTLFLAGIAVAAAIGLSRVYLRVHYLSDVSGGWALGAFVFALVAMVAMVLTHLRDNSDDRDPPRDRDA